MLLDIAKVSENIFEIGNSVALILTLTCLTIGVVLLSGAVTGFKMHKQNPKMVPLDRPIIYLILSFVISSMPFWGYLSNESINPRDIKRYQQRDSAIIDIDEPLS